MALAFPPRLLRFISIVWQIRSLSRSGGRSVLGTRQVVSSPAGYWYASLTLSIGTMAWNGSEELLEFDAFMARLDGSGGVVDLPYFDGRGPSHLLGLPATPTPFDDGALFEDGTGFSAPSYPVFLAEEAALNAVQVKLTYAPGGRPHRGQCITMPDGWMHRIADVLAQDGDTWTVLLRQWLLGDYPAGVPVEADHPTCRMRLVTDESGLLTRQAGQAWANPVLEFEQAF